MAFTDRVVPVVLGSPQDDKKVTGAEDDLDAAKLSASRVPEAVLPKPSISAESLELRPGAPAVTGRRAATVGAVIGSAAEEPGVVEWVAPIQEIVSRLGDRCLDSTEFLPAFAWSGLLALPQSAAPAAVWTGPALAQAAPRQAQAGGQCGPPRDIVVVSNFDRQEMLEVLRRNSDTDSNIPMSSLLAAYLLRLEELRTIADDDLSKISRGEVTLRANNYATHESQVGDRSAFLRVQRTVGTNTDGWADGLSTDMEAAIVALPNNRLATIVITRVLNGRGEPLDDWSGRFLRDFKFDGTT